MCVDGMDITEINRGMRFRVLEVKQLVFEFGDRFVLVVVFGFCLYRFHQVTFAETLYFRFVLVYTEHLADIVVIGRVFQERKCRSEANDKGQYEKTVFHVAKISNCCVFRCLFLLK